MAPKFKKDKHGIPDPLHIELPHSHKKILENTYIIVIVLAILSVLTYGIMEGWTPPIANASIMLVMALFVILGVMIFEKSSIAHRPRESSS